MGGTRCLEMHREGLCIVLSDMVVVVLSCYALRQHPVMCLQQSCGRDRSTRLRGLSGGGVNADNLGHR